MCYILFPRALRVNKEVIGLLNNTQIVLVDFPFDSPTRKLKQPSHC